jgi:hypothetical protein
VGFQNISYSSETSKNRHLAGAPLAFSTYKATAKETLQLFKNLASNLGDGETKRTAKGLRMTRETVAMELVKNQGRVIAEFKKKNHTRTSITN